MASPDAAAAGELVVTQVSVGGFDARVSADELTGFLESVAGSVWRCRVKTSWTPQDSFPDFSLLLPSAAAYQATPPPYVRAPPHAFVHFAHPAAARRAADAAARSQLLLGGKALRAASAPDSSLRADRRRSAKPFCFARSRVEVGELLAPDVFHPGVVEFVVDPFDGLCRLVFARDTAFAFPGYRRDASAAVALRCDLKLEFSVSDIAGIQVFEADRSLLLRLSAAPLLYYRTAADGVHDSVPYDLLDDDDPWIRITDITKVNQHQLTAEFFGLLNGEEDVVNDRVAMNRKLLRNCSKVADRFLRVTFMDEGMQLLNNNALHFYAAPIVKDLMSNSFRQTTAVHRRVRTFLTDGFNMCGRKYSFLAFSSNQLRDSSAWFFAEDGSTTARSIREWMGQFPSKNVAKHTARMGLCFTSTYATVKTQPHEVNDCVDDVEHNGYTFSDGIGKITPDLALEVAKKLPLTDNYPPSAYQIRYAGFKGVMAVWPGQNDGIRLSLRPSMRKFESSHNVLGVVSWTKFQPGFLNRQIITLLTSLEVPDAIFWQMQEAMLCNLNKILSDSNIAFEVVTISCAEHGTTPGLMLSAGFVPETEPHLKAMLLAIRSSQLMGLREKTRIFVPKGRWMMGCLDELGILEQGQCFIRASTPSLNNSFVMHGSRFSTANKNAEIIVGTVVMAKNPCLHPGDVRILEAVDVPELRHLVDCLVFPKKGERPHANEASGSDLDGDVYFVTWDEQLVPPGKKSWNPMDYSPAEANKLPRGIIERGYH
ncbi:hypothetical protein ACP70R_003326 [Stipagrostis hirtigluma subsp. patula]